MEVLFRLPSALPRHPDVETWLAVDEPMRRLARPWFEAMRACGPDVCELMHDYCPTACVGDAAFGYVAAYTAHVNVGFFHGSTLLDPAGLLEGTGKRMRHVKLRPDQAPDQAALNALIQAAYRDVRSRLGA